LHGERERIPFSWFSVAELVQTMPRADTIAAFDHDREGA
jgi:hypothetical protein